MNQVLTGKPSIDKPWLKYYPQQFLDAISIPNCTIMEYLKQHCPGIDVAALHYYGEDIPWSTIFDQADQIARSLRAIGLKEGDQIPAFLRLVPEFVPLLLAIETIGASLLCRDNTLEENVEAAVNAKAKVIFVHDFITQEEVDAFVHGGVEKIIALSPLLSGSRNHMAVHIQECLDSYYTAPSANSPAILTWREFLNMGNDYIGSVAADTDINRPLYRCYTSGSTGPSKQVIHSAKTMLDIICQMNFYGSSDDFRPNWLVTCLPPALVAVVVSMTLLPLASNKLLIMDPFVFETDVDLEVMHYKANNWMSIPRFYNVLLNSKRIPDDYDMSHLLASGGGSEALNNIQLRQIQNFFDKHNCKFRVTASYGSSEAGSNFSLPSPKEYGNGNVGIPMPLSTVSIFKFGTDVERGYNEIGEICKLGPGTMLGYDNEEATAKALQTHSDGNVWLHMGDMGYMDEDGILYVLGRGGNPRFGGGFLDILPMENLIAEKEIKGILDAFFVNIPDDEHPGYFLPYLYVVLEDGYCVNDIEKEVLETLEPHMKPVEIIQLTERPFWHFKTNRIGLTKDLQAKNTYTKQYV